MFHYFYHFILFIFIKRVIILLENSKNLSCLKKKIKFKFLYIKTHIKKDPLDSLTEKSNNNADIIVKNWTN